MCTTILQRITLHVVSMLEQPARSMWRSNSMPKSCELRNKNEITPPCDIPKPLYTRTKKYKLIVRRYSTKLLSTFYTDNATFYTASTCVCVV